MSKTAIYAHRGANREASENTRAAFERALTYPIDGIETDVQLSRDEVAVLWHDRDLKKLGLPGKRIDDYDFHQLKEMDFAAHFSGAQPECVVTLREFIENFGARCGLLLEIKNRSWEDVARHEMKVRQTLALAESVGEGVLVSSFNLNSLIYAHGIAPDFPLVLNLEPEHTVNDARRALDAHPFLHGLCVEVSTLDTDMVELVRERNRSIAVYTCNTDAEIERALMLGVDILISDVPQKALQMRDR
ncbi:MAG: glycerophosphodiester phosphodiesterase [Gammaproteobacteria bacterium]|nr:glycerophosphodiester phosphodiesterase [Gammaproteobacteria bacterium]MBU1624365.1 glycerophosphodiester phosphodiesterase [Gammaproteobacteria bacterium]MBU1981093.1 glycerophosphodiester phosphodiesterase [Gammaproteobacteria bacterium]